jgi:hypothetical protein
MARYLHTVSERSVDIAANGCDEDEEQQQDAGNELTQQHNTGRISPRGRPAFQTTTSTRMKLQRIGIPVPDVSERL